MEKTKEELRTYITELNYIRELEDEIEQLRTKAEAITKEISDMPIGSSTVKDKMAQCVAQIVDLTTKKAEYISKSLETLKRIESIIASLPKKYRNILHSIYIQGKSLTTVAADNGYDYIYFCRKVHKKALELYKKRKREL
jgi:septation ring formation regulator EzrA